MKIEHNMMDMQFIGFYSRSKITDKFIRKQKRFKNPEPVNFYPVQGAS